jgi:DNA helicase II / ATP-dependent DNA helicase PcrA
LAREKGISIIDVLNEILKGAIPETKLKTIVAEYRKIHQDLVALRAAILEDSETALETTFVKNEDDEFEFYELNQLYKKAVNDNGTMDSTNPENFEEWIRDVFGDLQEGITQPTTPDDIDHIRIMSLHSSKGLSAKLVILCSMIDHLMPFLPSDTPEEEMNAVIQEQRRLFYVAVTRCKSSPEYPGRLVISSFLRIPGVDALRMGLDAPSQGYLSVHSTRFIRDFGDASPKPVLGDTLL